MQNLDDPTEKSNAQGITEAVSRNELLVQLGKGLCEARLKAGLSIIQISETTRINSQFIESIERGDFSELPGLAFGRGFVDCICKELKLDAKIFLDLFDDYVRSNQLNDFKTLDPCNSKKIKQSTEEKRTLKNLNQFWNPSEKNSGLGKNRGSYISYSLYFAAVVGFLFVGISYFKKEQPVSLKPHAKDLVNTTSPIPDSMTQTSEFSAVPSSASNQVAPEKVQMGGLNPSNSSLTTPPKNLDSVSDKVGSPHVAGDIKTSTPQPQNLQQNTLNHSDQVKNAPQVPPTSVAEVVSKNTISIRVLEPLDIRHRCDGSGYQTKRWEKSGDISFNTTCEVTIFDAAAVELSFNGSPLGSLGNKNIRRNLSFSDQSVKRTTTNQL